MSVMDLGNNLSPNSHQAISSALPHLVNLSTDTESTSRKLKIGIEPFHKIYHCHLNSITMYGAINKKCQTHGWLAFIQSHMH